MNKDLQFLPEIIVRSPINSINESSHQLIFKEALYISSPDLYRELYEKNKRSVKINISLHKYTSRASNRSTPFGLFAGVSTATWGQKNNILCDSDLKSLYRKTRLNIDVLHQLMNELVKENYIKPYLKFHTNSSIYLIGNTYRYVECQKINSKITYELNSVERTPYLDLILHESQNELSETQLAQLLVNKDIRIEESTAYIKELIDSQILINQFNPILTGVEYFDSIIYHLKKILQQNNHEQLSQILNTLITIKNKLNDIDVNVINDINDYKAIYNHLKNLMPNTEESNLFQTDLFKKHINSTLDVTIQNQLFKVIKFLNKVSPIKTNFSLENFKTKFLLKYGDKEIPLSIVLDEETGLGYPCKQNNGINDLIDDINFPISKVKKTDSLSLYEECLLKLIVKSQKNNLKIIEINEADFVNIDFSNAILPSSIAIMFNLLDSESNKLKLINASNSSAINLLGRFAHTNEKICTLIENIADFEQDQMPDKILAEIVHLPENRIGNILHRPSIRKYEIPYLTQASVPVKNQIQINDLTIKIRGHKIILFDRKLNKEIIPRLSNAHNYKKSTLPVYYFLCDIQSQYFTKTNITFDWGVISSQFNFLPRIEFQNCILSPSKWRLTSENLEVFKNKELSDSERQTAFFELKRQLELPDTFLLVNEDQELLINCNSAISIESFIDMAKKNNEILLEEYLFNHHKSLIKDLNNNSYVNECVTILLNKKIIISNNNHFENSKPHINPPAFSLESNWLYYKIYCGAKSSDIILISIINHIVSILLKENKIDKWFFIRYHDPENHLRFRVHVINYTDLKYIQHLIQSNIDPLIKDYIISDVQTDIYERELERYGNNSIEMAEQLFYYDSTFTVDILKLINDQYSDTIRWQIAIKSLDEFLTEFKFTLDEKLQFVEKNSIAYFKEHEGNKALRITLDNKYRTFKKQIEDLFNWENDSAYFPILELLKQRKALNKPIVDELLLLDSKSQLKTSLHEIIASFIHMNLNRLFMGRNRTNEFVVYDLLSKHYKSTLVRLKTN